MFAASARRAGVQMVSSNEHDFGYAARDFEDLDGMRDAVLKFEATWDKVLLPSS